MKTFYYRSNSDAGDDPTPNWPAWVMIILLSIAIGRVIILIIENL